MTASRPHTDYSATENQEPYQQQYQYQKNLEPEAPSSTGGSSTTTRVRARAREEKAAFLRGQYIDACEYYAQSFHRSISPGIQREIAYRVKDGMTADVFRAAIDETMKAPRPSYAYLEAILRRCDLENIKTIEDWKRSKERYQASNNPALNYDQRQYTDDMFGEDFWYDPIKDFGEGYDGH